MVMKPSPYLLLLAASFTQANELRLSNNSIAEDQPVGTVVGSFFSDSFDAVHYLPGIKEVEVGDRHSLFIDEKGALWGMGESGSGQLGNTKAQNRLDLPKVNPKTGSKVVNQIVKRESSGKVQVVSVSADGNAFETFLENKGGKSVKILDGGVIRCFGNASSSAFIKEDGSLWYLGRLENGKRGMKKLMDGGILDYAQGDDFTLIVKSDGSLWGFGNNREGQLGVDATSQIRAPQKIIDSDVVSVAAGEEHALFIKSDGSLWGMGSNTDGQLGSDADMKTSIPVEIFPAGTKEIAAHSNRSFFTRGDGSLWMMGGRDRRPTREPLPELPKVDPLPIVRKGVVSFSPHSKAGVAFVLQDGSATIADLKKDTSDGNISWDINYRKFINSGARSLASSGYHVLFRMDDGSIKGMGNTTSGQLSVGGAFRKTPVDIPLPEKAFIPAGTDNSPFRIEGSRLLLRQPLDFETRPTHQIYVRSTDNQGRDVRKTFTIQVEDVKEPPSYIGLDPGHLAPENLAPGAVIGKLLAIGSGDAGDTTIELTPAPDGEEADNALFRVEKDPQGLPQLLAHGQGAFNFEQKARLTIYLKATNAEGLSHTQRLHLRLTNQNDPPSPPTLSLARIPAGSDPGTIAGPLECKDEDAGDTHKFFLLDSEDDASNDNNLFRIHVQPGGQHVLVLKDAITEPGEKKVVVEVEDSGGLRSRNTFQVKVEASPAIKVQTSPILETAEVGSVVATVSQVDPEKSPYLAGIHSLAYTTQDLVYVQGNGSLWALGKNRYGQLGTEDFESRDTPVKIVESGVKSVYIHENLTLFIKEDGSLWGVGDSSRKGIPIWAKPFEHPNNQGRSSPSTYTHTPEQILPSSIDHVWMGSHNIVFRKTDGSLWTFVRVNRQPVGFTTEPKQIVPSPVTSFTMFRDDLIYTRLDGSLWSTSLLRFKQGKESEHIQHPMVGISSVIRDDEVLAIKRDGSLWGYGSNHPGGYQDGKWHDMKRISANGVLQASSYRGPIYLKSDRSIWTYRRKTGQEWVEEPLIKEGGSSIYSSSTYNFIFNKDDGTLWGLGSSIPGTAAAQRRSAPNTPVQLLTYPSIPVPSMTDNAWFKVQGRDIVLARPLPLDKDILQLHLHVPTTTGLVAYKQFDIEIRRKEDPPTRVFLAKATVPEDTIGGGVVSQIGVDDLDAYDTHTFAFLPHPEGQPGSNHLFDIEPAIPPQEGFNLVTKTDTLLDFETHPLHLLRIEATDSTNKKVAQDIQLQVTDVDEAPWGISLESAEIPSNTGTGSFLTFVNVLDDEGDYPRVYLEPDGEENEYDNRYFKIQRIPSHGHALFFAPDAHPGSIDKDAFTLHIRAGTNRVQSYTQKVILPVSPAMGITPALFSVAENLPAGHIIGKLTLDGSPGNFELPGTKAISLGKSHTLYLEHDGTLWGSGSNQHGQLGDKAPRSTSKAMQIAGPGIRQIEAGQFHTLFIDKDKSLWASGNYTGERKYYNESTSNPPPPQRIATKVAQMAAGMGWSAYLKEDGTLWALGLPHATRAETPEIPVQIAKGGIQDIAAGDKHLVVLKKDSSLWGIGENSAGQCGIGPYSLDELNKIHDGPVSAISVHGLSTMFITYNGAAWFAGSSGTGTTFYGRQRKPTQTKAGKVLALASTPKMQNYLMEGDVLETLAWAYPAHLNPALPKPRNSRDNFQRNQRPNFGQRKRLERKSYQSTVAGVISMAALEGKLIVLKDDGSSWRRQVSEYHWEKPKGKVDFPMEEGGYLYNRYNTDFRAIPTIHPNYGRPAGTHNHLFAIKDGHLATNQPLDHETLPECRIYVRGTTAEGKAIHQILTIQVIDRGDAPRIAKESGWTLPENSPAGTEWALSPSMTRTKVTNQKSLPWMRKPKAILNSNRWKIAPTPTRQSSRKGHSSTLKRTPPPPSKSGQPNDPASPQHKPWRSTSPTSTKPHIP